MMTAATFPMFTLCQFFLHNKNVKKMREDFIYVVTKNAARQDHDHVR